MNGALLDPRWTRERNGGRGGRRQGGDVCDVGVLVLVLLLLAFTLATVLAALALGLAIIGGPLLLVLLLLLVALLIIEVGATALSLHHADLVGIVLASATTNGF